jgi:hypothetical protein
MIEAVATSKRDEQRAKAIIPSHFTFSSFVSKQRIF